MTYGLFILSLLGIVVIGLAWIFTRVDANTALAVISGILAANGLVTTTQWQAAPDIIGNLQAIISQLAGHIQTLHAQQLPLQSSHLPTAKLATVQAPAAPVTPIPQVAQQPFPPPSASMLGGMQSAPLNAQTWQSSSQLRSSSGG